MKMTERSDTPRVDKMVRITLPSQRPAIADMASLARTLERENSQLRSQRDELAEVLQDWLRIANATGGDSVIGNRVRAVLSKVKL
jgi:hypothetical protein